MNLDDLDRLRGLDSNHLLARIDRLPEDLWTAWQLGLRDPLPEAAGIQRVILAGVGEAGLAADLLAAYASLLCSKPILVRHDYDLPACAKDAGSLVILLGDEEGSEEWQSWQAVGNPVLCMVTPRHPTDLPHWTVDEPNRLAGFFGRLLALTTRLHLIPDPAADLRGAVAAMKHEQAAFMPEVPVIRNLAKREAGQIMGRLLVMFASEPMATVAWYWKAQINRMANAWAQVESLPDSNYSSLEGILNPDAALERVFFLFLQSESCHPRNRARTDLTRRGFMVAGLNTDTFTMRGETTLAQMWTGLHFGDYLAYYLAIAYAVDPSVQNISASFNRALTDWGN